MKLNVLSDLHLSLAALDPPDNAADVVVLAGDIARPREAIAWASALRKPVLYVAGNHEFYGSTIDGTLEALRAFSEGTQVRVLDDEALIVDGVRFLGSTLWTDFELFGEATLIPAIEESLRYVVDFRAIRYGTEGRFTPEHSLVLHRKSKAFLEQKLAKPFAGKTVVITHHAPHPGSVHPRWGANLTSAAFVSDLTPLLGPAVLWIHGHTHDGFDFRVNGTRIVANPMGYRSSNWKQARDGSVPAVVSYENGKFDPAMIIEI